MIILLIGPQGSGKDTEGILLSKDLDLPLIITGQLLRAISPDHPKYTVVKEQMTKGLLADYETTAGLIKDRVGQADCANGYILNGWGRVLEQFVFFDPIPDVVLYLNISRKESLRRLSGRRICEPTGEIFNIYTMSQEELAKCAGNLVQRADDTEVAVNKRLDIFEKDTLPVIEMYRSQGKLVEIDAQASIAEVHSRTITVLKTLFDLKV